MKLPLNTDLRGKVAVVTGAGGILCAPCFQGAGVCRRQGRRSGSERSPPPGRWRRINADGGTAVAYACNVLDKASMEACHQQVLAELGPCDILLNGAGGNNPRATTDKEYYEAGDLDAELCSFFRSGAEGRRVRFQPQLPGHADPHTGIRTGYAGA